MKRPQPVGAVGDLTVKADLVGKLHFPDDTGPIIPVDVAGAVERALGKGIDAPVVIDLVIHAHAGIEAEPS